MTLSLLIKPESYLPSSELGDDTHVWFLDINQLPEDVIHKHQHILSAEEAFRAKSLKHRKLQFFAMRELVRLCLSHYTKTTPDSLEVNATPKGKPFLANPNLPIKFNLSHCNNVAVLAVCLHDEIGIDVESITRNRSQRNIATRYFHPQELAQLTSMDDIEHNNYFFRLWTLKEAFFKATGDGISAGLDKAAFELENTDTNNNNAIKSMLSPELALSSDDWQFYQTFLSKDFCVALAKQTAIPVNIRWFNGSDLFI